MIKIIYTYLHTVDTLTKKSTIFGKCFGESTNHWLHHFRVGDKRPLVHKNFFYFKGITEVSREIQMDEFGLIATPAKDLITHRAVFYPRKFYVGHLYKQVIEELAVSHGVDVMGAHVEQRRTAGDAGIIVRVQIDKDKVAEPFHQSRKQFSHNTVIGTVVGKQPIALNITQWPPPYFFPQASS